MPEHFHAETSGLSDHHVQRQSSLGRGSGASGEPSASSQPPPPHQSAVPGPPGQEQGAAASRGEDILDCLMSGMRLALQWHLQHRYPNVWEQVCHMLNGSFIINSGMCCLPYFESYMPVLCHVFLQRVQELAAPVLENVDLAALALHIEVVRDFYNSADLLDTAIYLALLTASV